MKKKIIFGLILCAVLSVTGIYSVKDVKATGTYTTEQIKEYITAHEVPPTPEGKIFAGWYNGETPVKGTVDVTDTTVPKFVDDDVLTVKFQILEKTTTTSTTTDVRFLTSVDSLKYQSVQFEVTLNKTVTKPVNKVYTSVNAEGEKFTPKEVFSKDSNYIATVLMTDFTKDSTESDKYGYWGKTITVTPKWTTMDGTTVEGTTREIEVNDGLYDTELTSASAHTWHTLEDGFKTAVDSEENVTLDILQDVSKTSMSQIAINDPTNKTITVNGGGHTLKLDGNTEHTFSVVKPYGKFAINDITIIHDETTTQGKQVFVFGSSGSYVSGTNLEVEFKGVTINSKSSNAYALINVQTSQQNTITMTNTNITWDNANVKNTTDYLAAIRVRPNNNKADNLTMDNCTIDVKMYEVGGIYLGSKNTGTVTLTNTTINTEGTSNIIKESVVRSTTDKFNLKITDCTLNNPTYGYVATTTVGETVTNHRSLVSAINAMNAATKSDVMLTLLGDVTTSGRYRLGTPAEAGHTITINGKKDETSNYTWNAALDSSDGNLFRMHNAASYTLALQDVNFNHSGNCQFLRMGNGTTAESINAAPIKLSLDMDNVVITSTSTRKDTLINLMDNEEFDVDMNKVNITWTNEATPDSNAAVIRFGIANQGKKVTLNMTNSSITSSTEGISGLYIPVGVLGGSAVTLDNTSSITTAGETPLYIKDDDTCEITGITQ